MAHAMSEFRRTRVGSTANVCAGCRAHGVSDVKVGVSGLSHDPNVDLCSNYWPNAIVGASVDERCEAPSGHPRGSCGVDGVGRGRGVDSEVYVVYVEVSVRVEDTAAEVADPGVVRCWFCCASPVTDLPKGSALSV